MGDAVEGQRLKAIHAGPYLGFAVVGFASVSLESVVNACVALNNPPSVTLLSCYMGMDGDHICLINLSPGFVTSYLSSECSSKAAVADAVVVFFLSDCYVGDSFCR